MPPRFTSAATARASFFKSLEGQRLHTFKAHWAGVIIRKSRDSHHKHRVVSSQHLLLVPHPFISGGPSPPSPRTLAPGAVWRTSQCLPFLLTHLLAPALSGALLHVPISNPDSTAAKSMPLGGTANVPPTLWGNHEQREVKEQEFQTTQCRG